MKLPILAWIFLGESITIQEGIGMSIATIGAVFVQIKRKLGIGIDRTVRLGSPSKRQ